MASRLKIKTRDKELSPKWYIAKEVFRRKGMTYARFAELSGQSVTAVHDMLNYPPSIIHIKMMADILKVPFFDFFDFTRDEGAATVPAGSTAVRDEDLPQSFRCPSCGALLNVSLNTSNFD